MSGNDEDVDHERVAMIAGIHMVLSTILGIALATIGLLHLEQWREGLHLLTALILFANLPRLADNYRLHAELRHEAQEESNIYPS